MQSIQFASDKKISKASTKGQAVTCIQKSLTTFIYCISTIKLCLFNHMITNTWCLTMKNCDKRISLLKILFKNFSNSLQWIHIHVTMTHMCSPAKDYTFECCRYLSHVQESWFTVQSRISLTEMKSGLCNHRQCTRNIIYVTHTVIQVARKNFFNTWEKIIVYPNTFFFFIKR